MAQRAKQAATPYAVAAQEVASEPLEYCIGDGPAGPFVFATFYHYGTKLYWAEVWIKAHLNPEVGLEEVAHLIVWNARTHQEVDKALRESLEKLWRYPHPAAIRVWRRQVDP